MKATNDTQWSPLCREQVVRAVERKCPIDTFDRPAGGTPLENIEAFPDKALRYGTLHRRQFASGR